MQNHYHTEIIVMIHIIVVQIINTPSLRLRVSDLWQWEVCEEPVDGVHTGVQRGLHWLLLQDIQQEDAQ